MTQNYQTYFIEGFINPQKGQAVYQYIAQRDLNFVKREEQQAKLKAQILNWTFTEALRMIAVNQGKFLDQESSFEHQHLKISKRANDLLFNSRDTRLVNDVLRLEGRKKLVQDLAEIRQQLAQKQRSATLQQARTNSIASIKEAKQMQMELKKKHKPAETKKQLQSKSEPTVQQPKQAVPQPKPKQPDLDDGLEQ